MPPVTPPKFSALPSSLSPKSAQEAILPREEAHLSPSLVFRRAVYPPLPDHVSMLKRQAVIQASPTRARNYLRDTFAKVHKRYDEDGRIQLDFVEEVIEMKGPKSATGTGRRVLGDIEASNENSNSSPENEFDLPEGREEATKEWKERFGGMERASKTTALNSATAGSQGVAFKEAIDGQVSGCGLVVKKKRPSAQPGRSSQEHSTLPSQLGAPAALDLPSRPRTPANMRAQTPASALVFLPTIDEEDEDLSNITLGRLRARSASGTLVRPPPPQFRDLPRPVARRASGGSRPSLNLFPVEDNLPSDSIPTPVSSIRMPAIEGRTDADIEDFTAMFSNMNLEEEEEEGGWREFL